MGWWVLAGTAGVGVVFVVLLVALWVFLKNKRNRQSGYKTVSSGDPCPDLEVASLEVSGWGGSMVQLNITATGPGSGTVGFELGTPPSTTTITAPFTSATTTVTLPLPSYISSIGPYAPSGGQWLPFIETPSGRWCYEDLMERGLLAALPPPPLIPTDIQGEW